MTTASSTLRIAVAATALALGPLRAEAQVALAPSDGRFWAGAAALLGTAFLFDAGISSAASRNTHTSLARFADALQPLGRQGVVVPALAATLAASWAVGGWRPARAVLRIAAGYAAGDLLMSALKPAIGRHRPDSAGGDPWRFEPFAGGDQWHSMPSAHATHIFSLAEGIADEVRVPAIRVAAYGVAALVGWQRIAFRGHWPSDVVAGGVLGVAAAGTTGRWLRGGPLRDGARGAARLMVTPNALFISAELP